MHTQSGKQRRYLRSLGHHLRALVLLGKAGLTENVILQIEQNLVAHELVKVKLPKVLSDERKSIAENVAQQTHSELIQIVGYSAIFYRPHPEKPKITLPRR